MFQLATASAPTARHRDAAVSGCEPTRDAGEALPAANAQGADAIAQGEMADDVGQTTSESLKRVLKVI